MFKIQKSAASIAFAVAFLSLAACSPQPSAVTSETTPPAAPAAVVATPPAAKPEVVVIKAAPVVERVVCDTCGIVRSVTEVTGQGSASGLGGVIGGIVGGVAGNQVGGGDGKKLATVAGVIGGAVLGNKIEKDRNGTTYYEVSIDMENGGQRVISVPNTYGINPGAAVMVNGNDITLR